MSPVLLLIFLCFPTMLVALHTVPPPSSVDFCQPSCPVPNTLFINHTPLSFSLPRRCMQWSHVNVGTCVWVCMASCPRRRTFLSPVPYLPNICHKLDYGMLWMQTISCTVIWHNSHTFNCDIQRGLNTLKLPDFTFVPSDQLIQNPC
jgi:hypothetical protein